MSNNKKKNTSNTKNTNKDMTVGVVKRSDTVKKEVSEKIEDVKSAVEETVNEIKDNLEDAINEVKADVVETVEDAMSLCEKEHKKRTKKTIEEKRIITKTPDWFDKEIEKEKINDGEDNQLEELLKEYK